MPRFTVKEAQKVTRLRVWTWTVEAATEAEAIALAQAGEGDMCPDGHNVGEEGYGESRWAAATEEEAEQGRDLTEEAIKNFEAIESPVRVE